MTFARSGPEHIKQIGCVTDFMHSLQCGDHAARLGDITELVQTIQMHLNTKAFHSLNTSQCLTVRRSSDISLSLACPTSTAGGCATGPL